MDINTNNNFTIYKGNFIHKSNIDSVHYQYVNDNVYLIINLKIKIEGNIKDSPLFDDLIFDSGLKVLTNQIIIKYSDHQKAMEKYNLLIEWTNDNN